MSATTKKVQKVLDALKDTARIASVMVDGEEAARIVTDKAAHYIVNPDPAHRYMAGDYYAVDQPTFLRMKKTLTRLACLPDFPCSVTLWVKVQGGTDIVTPAVMNGPMGRYYRFGEGHYTPQGEMAECLTAGRMTVAPSEDTAKPLTVLAPVFDSLGDTVGAVEFSAKHPGSKAPAPAWS